ncbi:helix-turn-helix transcriptional regulator [Streptomyces rhizosphaerihabitans]|uniref:helix-turn-helix transcriptional regulator n=1 Tax=Streptomyces rhizosphaerihabitans TaxID=1266770 RepID=UPI0021BFE288|nr:helix-turn-helix transcriptional regulator [Streptomyces rhizosphaerihabitans]MCT9008493.1 helix-turn-helix transcriptional regulator [Streptomyces rhizosphaerihabitans]
MPCIKSATQAEGDEMESKAYLGSSSFEDECMRRLYEFVLSRDVSEEINVEEVALQLNLPVGDTSLALAGLVEMGLLRDRPGWGLVAVAPDEAVSRVLGPLELEIRTRRVQAEETRRRLMSFLPAFDAHLTAGGNRRQVELIDNLADVRVAIAELSAKCRKEILTAQPGGGRKESVLIEAAPRDYETLQRGVKMRILYQHTARSSRGTHSYVQEVTRLGAQVRTLDDQFMRFLIFDRECAMFAVSDDPDSAAFIRDPHVVAFMVEAYERLWLAAEPFSVDSDTQPETTDDLKEAIIRLLTAGMTDAAVARRLGMSVRTCRRHVSEIMTGLGAASRFQAGYLLAVQE